MKPQEGGQQQQRQSRIGQPQSVITRTRQDMINTGELFRINGKVAVQQEGARATPASSEMSPDGNRKILFQDCCFIFVNSTLVVATAIAIIVLYRFFQDEPLNNYYEYLLTMRFYWQMIFVACLMPPILLVPVLTLLNRLLTHSKPTSSGRRLALRAKLFYQVLIWLMGLLALVFVAPFIRSTTLQSQIRLELNKFMQHRYDNVLAFKLLDDIQSHYECCDHMWYRANFRDQLPLSCFVRDTNYTVFFDRTCSETLSSIVGLRCYLLAGCLIVILIALACLSFIELNHLLTDSRGDRRHYEISRGSSSSSDSNNNIDSTPNGLGTTAATAAKAAMNSTEFDRLVQLDDAELSGGKTAANNRYKPREHDGSQPLLDERNRARPPVRERFSPLGGFDSAPDTKRDTSGEPVLLTRANYQDVKRERSQSPVFVPSRFQLGEATRDLRANSFDEQRRDSPGELAKPAIKSALKKANSNSSSTMVDLLDGPNPPTQLGSADRDDTELLIEQRRRAPLGQFEYDSDEVEDEDEDDYTDRLRCQSDTLLRQKQLFQREQTRRSLLSVRFADETDT